MLKKLLFDDAYHFQFVDDKKSWFMQMEELDLIYHQSFFPANSLGHQPPTSHDFQHVARHTLAVAVAAIHCALSAYASGM